MGRPKKDAGDNQDATDAPESNRQDEVTALLEQFKGRGLQINFDDDGSVTFMRGRLSESINLTADDRLIVAAARRIAVGS